MTKQEKIQEAYGEYWMPCKGYEGFYEVSNFGNIRSIDRPKKISHNKTGIHKGRMLKPLKNKYGYMKVSLTTNSIYKTVNMHRLIAETFIPNPNNKPQVNHKNGDKSDNCVENLEWATREENMRHAHLNGLVKMPKGKEHHYNGIKSDLHPRARAVIDTETKEIFGCIKDCAKSRDLKEPTLRGWLKEPRINPTKIMYLDDYKNNNGWFETELLGDEEFHGFFYEKDTNNIIIAYYDLSRKQTFIRHYSHFQEIQYPQPPIY